MFRICKQHGLLPIHMICAQEYKTIFEKMMMEEALAQLMQGSEAAELIMPQPAVLVSASQVRMRSLPSACQAYMTLAGCGCCMGMMYVQWRQHIWKLLRVAH
jgi:hypothetical protein